MPDPIPPHVQHTAGPMMEKMQFCLHCGMLLVDNRNMVPTHGFEYPGFSKGRLVYVYKNTESRSIYPPPIYCLCPGLQ